MYQTCANLFKVIMVLQVSQYLMEFVFFLLYQFLEIHWMTNVQRLVVRRLEKVTLKLTLLMRIHKW